MKLSVIVPAYREGGEAASQIHKLARHPLVFEVVVAAFDCQPAFNRVLRKIPKIKPLAAPKRGRAAQMNYGAAAAKGDLLLFLHADSRLERGGVEELTENLRQAKWVGGAFRLGFNRSGRGYRLKAWGANLRSRTLGMPYGDQGYFVWREIFDRLGGYQNLPLFEDVEFFDRLRRQGPWVLLKSTIVTSARRWEKQGYWKATFKNALWIVLYRLGVSPRLLAKWY
ncbi:MAG TPA: TIGR04283 family arsenosugar biosynthesis glycosyltransferase [bacterium]|nr:TIGR04283 family arsenosugar biosynthesis glycosyltransferase [bacterium]